MIKVLLVASASDQVDRLATRLRAEGYAVTHAGSGEAALVWLDTALPHLVLLDWHLPQMSGAALCHLLRADARLIGISISVLGAAAWPDDRLLAEGLGADDYITPPCDLGDLMEHVRTQVRYAAHDGACPLTGLPTGPAVVAAVRRALTAEPPRTVIYVTIEHLPAYAATYSLLAGNTLIEVAATALRQALHGPVSDRFLGSTGGGEFVIVTPPQHAGAIPQEATARFQQAVADGCFYPAAAYQQGYIVAADPQGHPYHCPLVALSFDQVTAGSPGSPARPAGCRFARPGADRPPAAAGPGAPPGVRRPDRRPPNGTDRTGSTGRAARCGPSRSGAGVAPRRKSMNTGNRGTPGPRPTRAAGLRGRHYTHGGSVMGGLLGGVQRLPAHGIRYPCAAVGAAGRYRRVCRRARRMRAGGCALVPAPGTTLRPTTPGSRAVIPPVIRGAITRGAPGVALLPALPARVHGSLHHRPAMAGLTPGPIRVLIVDGDPRVGRALGRLLQGTRDVEVIATATAAAAGLAWARHLRPTVAVVDAQSVGIDGLAMTRCLRQAVPAPQVVVVSVYATFRAAALAAGACRFLRKDCSRAELVTAVRWAAHGHCQTTGIDGPGGAVYGTEDL